MKWSLYTCRLSSDEVSSNRVGFKREISNNRVRPLQLYKEPCPSTMRPSKLTRGHVAQNVTNIFELHRGDPMRRYETDLVVQRAEKAEMNR